MSDQLERPVTLPITKKTLHIVDWLPPDFGAVGQYDLAWCRKLAAQGQRVVLAGLSTTASSVETEAHGKGSLKIIRLKCESVDKKNFARRIKWMAKTNLRLLWHLRKELKLCDEIVFSGSPPYMLWFIWPVGGRIFNKHLVYRISDFHPECLMAGMKHVPWPVHVIHAVTNMIRSQINGFEAIGVDMRRRLLEQGVPSEKIALRRDPSPVVVSPRTSPLAIPASLAGYKILLYSGNFGYAHEYETFTEAYIRHHREGSGKVALWLNAGGIKADKVEAIIREAGMPVHRGAPVAIEELPNLLATPDAHLVTLLDSFVGYVLPSKVYGAIESGKQVLFVGSQESDVDLLCREGMPAERYHRASVGDVDAAFAALERIGASGATPQHPATMPPERPAVLA